MSRKKPSRSSTAKIYATASTLGEAGISFPAMFFGMIVSLTVVMLVYGYFQAPIATKVALEQLDAKEADVGSIAADLDDDGFTNVVESQNVEQLTTLLQGVELQELTKRDDAQVFPASKLLLNRRRIEIAKRLMSMSLDDKQRLMAIKSKIDALFMVYALDRTYNLKQPNIATTLHAVATSFCSHSDPEIARLAKLALFKHDAFESSSDQAGPNLAPIAEKILDLMKEYPDNEDVLRDIRRVVKFYEQVSSQVGVNHSLELIQRIREGANDLDSPQFLELVRTFSDQARIAEVSFGIDFENRSFNGPVGEVKLEESCLELMSDPESGTLIFDRVEQVVLWFEQRLQLERTAKVYQAMLAASEVNQYVEVAAFARKRAEFGLQRMKIANQPIDLTGVESLVSRHNGIIVLFWSPESKSSISALLQVSEETQDWRRRNGIVLAVGTGAMTDEQRRLRDSVSGVVSLEAEAGSKIRRQCPSESLPHVILIDKRGTVVNTNVPVGDLKTEAEFLMSGE
ncbi:MAG: hypothetical protein ACI814_000339 [Mariniblastus sp.]|jgi:hypothetical protein